MGGAGENRPYTQCPSFVEDNTIVCHSERSEESRHFFALIELSNAGILLPQGGIRMTDGGLFFYE
jgi:hypothetical protein